MSGVQMSLVLILNGKNAVREIFDWGELTWFANARLGNSDEMTLGQCRIKVGYENPRHYHPNCEEILYVTQGQITHTVGDEAMTMFVGDTIVIPPNLLHNARNTGDEEAVMIIVFSSAHRQTVGE